jgi:hypothetical protein
MHGAVYEENPKPCHLHLISTKILFSFPFIFCFVDGCELSFKALIFYVLLIAMAIVPVWATREIN